MLARVGHFRVRYDGDGASAFAWTAAALLVSGLGFQILAKFV